MKRVIPNVLIAFSLGALLAGRGWGQSLLQGIGGIGATGSNVKAEAVIDTTAVGPGKAFTLGVTLTTNTGYHIYWTNPGESGLATKFKLELPEGFKAEPMAFPVPMKFVQPGDIAGYGYTGKTTFLFTITPPATLKAGASIGSITVNATWLCCDKEKCVPGSAKVEVPLSAGTGAAANGEVFAAARAALPARRNPPEVKAVEANLATVREGGPMMQSLGWNITWAGEKPPEGVEFFPADLEGLKVDRIDVGTMPAVGGGVVTRITVRAHVMQGQQLGGDRFTGLVTFNRADGTRTGFLTSADVRSLAETQPAATKP